MKGLLIFAGGVVTGAAATLGVLTLISKKREKNDIPEEMDICVNRDDWEEVPSPSVKEEKEVEEEKEKEEEVPMDDKINVEKSDYHNMVINKYVSENREIPDRFLDPIIFTEEEYTLSPYDKEVYTYLSKDDVLLDENGAVVADGRCGDEFFDICLQEGVAYVCNEELEMDYKIVLNSEDTFEEMSLSDDEWYDD